jgi:hypothetical protein
MPTSIHGTNGITFNDGSTQTTRPAVGFRNRIINGDMRIFQRATNGTTLNSLAYALDRMWMFSGLGVAATGSQVTSTGLSGFPNAMRMQRNSGNTGTTGLYVGQVIETSNCQDLAGQTISISFWARAGANFSSTSSALTVGAFTGTGTDQGIASAIASTWTGLASATIGTATITTSWQKFAFTYSVPAGTNEISLYIFESPTGTAGANDYFDITGVQLEAGSTATEFERRPIGMELALCQRYYEKSKSAHLMYQSNQGTTARRLRLHFVAEKRVAPSSVNPTGDQGMSVFDITTTSFYASSNGGLGVSVDANVLTWDASAEL